MSFKPLAGIRIIDLTQRLPGPLCGKILADLGANVIKIEDFIIQDSFLSDPFAQFDSSFISWYKHLNAKKEIQRFHFNMPDDQKKIHEMVINSDAVLIGLSANTRKKLQITNEDLNLKRPMVVLELLASACEQKSMHDLNALATTGLLSLYVANRKDKIIDPPFLPIAGITFGQQAATHLLAAFIQATKQNTTQFVKIYLDQTTSELGKVFLPTDNPVVKQTKFLHNGAYPCYSIYQTKDYKYVALAAVEEKFWNRFCEIFHITNAPHRFFNENSTLFEKVSQELYKYTSKEIEFLIKNENICLSVIN